MAELRALTVVHLSHSVVPVQPAVRNLRPGFGLTPFRGWVFPATVGGTAR